MAIERLPYILVDVWYLALTIWAEARGEGPRGMEYVAWVIRNRVKDARWPNSIPAVVRQPKQFSCWNPDDPNRRLMADPLQCAGQDLEMFHQALRIAVKVILADEADNPLPGVCHYYAATLKQPPAWAKGMEVVRMADSPGHVFLREARRP